MKTFKILSSVLALVVQISSAVVHAADVSTAGFAIQLPAKKAKSGATSIPTKRPKLKMSPVVKLPQTLPAFKGSTKTRVQVDFTQPALSPEIAVAIREDHSLADSTNTLVQTIRKHEVKEAPLLEVVNEAYEVAVSAVNSRPLKQALPDSDSYLGVPVDPQTLTAPIAVEAARALTPEPLVSSSPFIYPIPSSETVEAPPLPPHSVIPEGEVAIDAEKGAHESGYSTPGSATLKTTFLIPHDEVPRRRIFVRTGYLDARYDRLESDLKNGATMFGVSVSQVFSKTEVRLGIDFAHGLDQAVTLRNTRMAMFRAEGLFTFLAADRFQAFAGGVIGVVDIDVTSYRASTTSGEAVLRENAKGTALLAAPVIGGRARIGRELSLDLSAQYLLFAGGDEINRLGGLLGELAIGFRF